MARLTLYRLKGRADGPLVKLADPSRVRRNPSGDLNRAAVAERLGVSRADVAALVKAGLLADDARGDVAETELDRFVRRELEPVEYVEAGASGAAAEPEPEPEPEPEAPAPTDEPTAPRRRASAVRPVEPDDDEQETDPAYALIVPCPGCGTPLGIAEGVERFRCPRCGQRLEVVQANPAEPVDERDVADGGYWLGIKALGRRRR